MDLRPDNTVGGARPKMTNTLDEEDDSEFSVEGPKVALQATRGM